MSIQDLFDDAKCYQTIRDMRRPDGVTCPRCSSGSVIKNGRDDTEPHRQRYECKGCRLRLDDPADTIFAGHHPPLRTRIARLYLMGPDLSGLQIARELDINRAIPRPSKKRPPTPTAATGGGAWAGDVGRGGAAGLRDDPAGR